MHLLYNRIQKWLLIKTIPNVFKITKVKIEKRFLVKTIPKIFVIIKIKIVNLLRNYIRFILLINLLDYARHIIEACSDLGQIFLPREKSINFILPVSSVLIHDAASPLPFDGSTIIPNTSTATGVAVAVAVATAVALPLDPFVSFISFSILRLCTLSDHHFRPSLLIL